MGVGCMGVEAGGGSDAVNPGLEGRLRRRAAQVQEGFEEDILRQFFGQRGVAHAAIDVAED